MPLSALYELCFASIIKGTHIPDSLTYFVCNSGYETLKMEFWWKRQRSFFLSPLPSSPYSQSFFVGSSVLWDLTVMHWGSAHTGGNSWAAGWKHKDCMWWLGLSLFGTDVSIILAKRQRDRKGTDFSEHSFAGVFQKEKKKKKILPLG